MEPKTIVAIVLVLVSARGRQAEVRFADNDQQIAGTLLRGY